MVFGPLRFPWIWGLVREAGGGVCFSKASLAFSVAWV